MKYALLALSVLCLSFTFVKGWDLNENNIPQEIPAAAPDEPVSTATASKGAGVSDVVTQALAFKNLLSASQQTTLQQTYTTTLARKWSNLPCGGGCRNGIEFLNLTSAQLNAAQAVIKAALGSGANNGYDEWAQIRLAEANLHANGGGNGYDTTLRWIAFLNTPSATGAWMLQFGGHHYAANIAFNNGHVIGATPFFMGVEPKVFTINGATYAPLNDERNAAAAMLASLSGSQLTTAKLNQTFSDCTLVPGESNGGSGTFPATKAGIACSTMTTAQKDLVLAAIMNYVQDMDTATANNVMAVYTNEINSTYVAYTGNGTSGDSSSFMNANSNYFRIDGPTVWIEMSCQNGVVYQNQIHYHTIWRDHSHDYGVDLSGSAIDGSSTTPNGIASVKTTGALIAYPNPANNTISVSLNTEVSNANVIIISATTGQKITIATHRSGKTFSYDVSRMPSGMYLMRIEDANSVYTGKFTKL